MARNDAEFRLTVLVADLLRFKAKPGVYFTHMPMGEARSAKTGARLKRMGTRPGAGDFLILHAGQANYLELKVKGGHQNLNQLLTEQDWKAAGGEYRLATGYDEALAFLEEIGVLR